MAAIILGVGEHHLVAVHEGHGIQHGILFWDEFLPVLIARFLEVCHHQAILLCASIGEHVDVVADDFHRRIGLRTIARHLDELGVWLAEVTHEEVDALVHARLGEEHHRLFLVYAHAIEAERIGWVLIEELVLALRCTHLVVIYLLDFVLRRSFLALLWCIVGAVIKTIALPVGARELRPNDMVGEELLGLHVHHVDLFPVASASGDGVGEILAVIGEGDAFEGYGSVVAQLVWVEEHASFASELVHLVEHSLVLQTVVLIDIPLSVLLERGIDLLVVSHLLEAFQILVALRYLGEVSVGYGVLCLYPSRSCRTGIVFERAEWIRYFFAEVFVHRIVLRGGRILQVLSHHGSGAHHSHGGNCQR